MKGSDLVAVMNLLAVKKIIQSFIAPPPGLIISVTSPSYVLIYAFSVEMVYRLFSRIEQAQEGLVSESLFA